LAGGCLRSFSTETRGAAPWQLREISRPGEQVEAFGVRRELGQETSYGWYRVARDDSWEIILFALDGGGNLVFEKTRLWPHIPRLEYGVTREGKAVFTITAGSAVSVHSAEGLLFMEDLYFDAPFAVKRHSPALLTGGPVGLLTGEREGAEVLYGVSHERSGAPALRELFARPQAEFLSLFFAGDDRISLLYRSNQTLRSALIRPGGGVIDDRALSVPSGGAALFRHPQGTGSVHAPSEAGLGELRVLSLFKFEDGAWRPGGDLGIPRFFPEEAHAPIGIRDEDLLLMSSPEAFMLYEIASSGLQTLEMQNYDRSVAHNGVVYLVVSSENGIALYRIEE
jgi:hypothetical protein